MLEVDCLTRSFGRRGWGGKGLRTVVDAVSFTAPSGQVTALLGHNGSGKSTTLRMCAGALRPTAGTITFDGERAGPGSVKVKRLTGYIPDIGGVFPRLSGWEHMQLAARLFGLDGWEPRADALLEVLGIAEAKGSLAGTYSHGMSRKLSCAIAFLPDPQLLLADEPFDGVDAEGVAVMSSLLVEAAGNGATVVLATHLLDVAARICSSTVRLNAGQVVVQ